MKRIRFKINYEVKLKRKFQEFLERYQNDIGFEFQELKIDRYWKIEEQFQASFFVETNLKENEKVVYQILTFANKLEPTGGFMWSVNGPNVNSTLTFECVLNNDTDDQPLKWAHLKLEIE